MVKFLNVIYKFYAARQHLLDVNFHNVLSRNWAEREIRPTNTQFKIFLSLLSDWLKDTKSSTEMTSSQDKNNETMNTMEQSRSGKDPMVETGICVNEIGTGLGQNSQLQDSRLTSRDFGPSTDSPQPAVKSGSSKRKRKTPVQYIRRESNEPKLARVEASELWTDNPVGRDVQNCLHRAAVLANRIKYMTDSHMMDSEEDCPRSTEPRPTTTICYKPPAGSEVRTDFVDSNQNKHEIQRMVQQMQKELERKEMPTPIKSAQCLMQKVRKTESKPVPVEFGTESGVHSEKTYNLDLFRRLARKTQNQSGSPGVKGHMRRAVNQPQLSTSPPSQKFYPQLFTESCPVLSPSVCRYIPRDTQNSVVHSWQKKFKQEKFFFLLLRLNPLYFWQWIWKLRRIESTLQSGLCEECPANCAGWSTIQSFVAQANHTT